MWKYKLINFPSYKEELVLEDKKKEKKKSPINRKILSKNMSNNDIIWLLFEDFKNL